MVNPAVRRGAFVPRPTRRTIILAAGLALAAGFPLRAQAARPRLAAIDWAMLETAIAIGHMPVAAAELIRFRDDNAYTAIPDDVTDLGLRGAPNFELLQLTRPDLILNSPYYERYNDRLGTVAPVLSLPFFIPAERPLPKALSALTALADAVDDPDAGSRAVAQTEQALDELAVRLMPYRDRPVALVNIGDARHMRTFGFDSLFGSTLERLSLTNAFAEATRFSFLAPVAMEALTTVPDARVVNIGAIPAAADRALSRSVLWRALPAVADNRTYQLPTSNAFGGVPSALNFAQTLAAAFDAGPTRIA